jgi:Helix-turn-helix domain
MTNPPAKLRRGAKITGPQRDELVDEWRKQYQAGRSIREIAHGSGRSYGFVRQVIAESGVSLRSRGGARPRAGRSVNP